MDRILALEKSLEHAREAKRRKLDVLAQKLEQQLAAEQEENERLDRLLQKLEEVPNVTEEQDTPQQGCSKNRSVLTQSFIAGNVSTGDANDLPTPPRNQDNPECTVLDGIAQNGHQSLGFPNDCSSGNDDFHVDLSSVDQFYRSIRSSPSSLKMQQASLTAPSKTQDDFSEPTTSLQQDSIAPTLPNKKIYHSAVERSPSLSDFDQTTDIKSVMIHIEPIPRDLPLGSLALDWITKFKAKQRESFNREELMGLKAYCSGGPSMKTFHRYVPAYGDEYRKGTWSEAENDRFWHLFHKYGPVDIEFWPFENRRGISVYKRYMSLIQKGEIQDPRFHLDDGRQHLSTEMPGSGQLEIIHKTKKGVTRYIFKR
ncbi:hypothetical protein BKA69DRAFT_1100675 [Paraphysoderma sedebokerense]|nr:hypothetical protein BKA69DRAFT_1100675 [Paraphysoderma sedebokerense]